MAGYVFIKYNGTMKIIKIEMIKEIKMDKELSLPAIFRLLKNKIRWIISTILVFMVSAVVLSLFVMKPLYSSTAELLVSPKSASSQQLTLNQLDTNAKLIKTYENIILSDDILTLVNKKISADYSSQDLRGKISVTTDADSQTFGIKAEDSSPALAAEIANTVAEIFQDKLDSYYAFNLKIRVISAAKVANQKSSPNLLKNLAFSIALGLVVSFLAIILFELLTPTVGGTGLLERFKWLELGSLQLGTFTQRTSSAKRKQTRKKLFKPEVIHDKAILDNIEGIKVKLKLQLKKHQAKSFLITSPETATGKSTFATYLAKSFARDGQKVLLVDANFRNPSLHHILSLPNDTGLTTYLEGFDDVELPLMSHEKMNVLTTGPKQAHNTDLLTGKKMDELLIKLEEQFDYIIFDTSSLNGIPDAQILATKIKNVVMLVKRDYTRTDDLIESNRFIVDYDIQVLGYVFNGEIRDRESTFQKLFYK